MTEASRVLAILAVRDMKPLIIALILEWSFVLAPLILGAFAVTVWGEKDGMRSYKTRWYRCLVCGLGLGHTDCKDSNGQDIMKQLHGWFDEDVLCVVTDWCCCVVFSYRVDIFQPKCRAHGTRGSFALLCYIANGCYDLVLPDEAVLVGSVRRVHRPISSRSRDVDDIGNGPGWARSTHGEHFPLECAGKKDL